MNELTWSQEMLQEHVAPAGIAQYVETRIRHAARQLRWKFSRTKSLWYADERATPRPREIRDLEAYTGLRYGQQELRSNDQLIASADALLMGTDPDFAGAFVVALRAFMGALDSTRARGGGK